MQVSRHPYGAHSAQFGELYRPARGRPHGSVVIAHGGFWRAKYDLRLGAPLARDLAGHGYTCWNLEYRRVGGGGGWPMTFDDVAAGVDRLAELDVDTSRLVMIGHSAGGHLATWAAGRAGLPANAPGANPRVLVGAVVSQAGVLDVVAAARDRVGGSAVPDLLGGPQRQHPQRYRLADPMQQLPLAAPVLCVHARADADVPLAQSAAYVEAARRTGGQALLAAVTGDHFTVIDPSSPAWALVRGALPDLLAGRLPG